MTDVEIGEVELMGGEKVVYQIPVHTSRAAIADAASLGRSIHCMLWLGLNDPGVPLTADEEREGYRTVQHDDHEHTYAVGWRADEERKAAEAQREAEMAACPYIACTCGHHEE